MAPKKIGAHVKGKALIMNNKLTHSEAQQKCIDWIITNPDKCLHLYGMINLGLCEPRAEEKPEKTAAKKVKVMPDIPASKTTLGQVSHKHIMQIVSTWHPDAETWVHAYGPRTAHQLFYFGTASHDRVSVHEHGFEKFSTFYTIRYQALGSRLNGCARGHQGGLPMAEARLVCHEWP